jgi:succinate-semialdehyde dehydrogenase/glutarate-semialdehyde dehydrogenase
MIPEYPEIGLLLDGELVAGDGRTVEPVLNPASESELGQLTHASKSDLDRALELAAAGFAEWRAVSPEQRGRVLARAAALIRERKETLARIATMEAGKSIHETRIEVEISAGIFDWYAEEGRRAYGRVLAHRQDGTRQLVVREPVGPVAGFAPWNFPLGNPARKLGASLGAGCSCILKPAEETPASALGIARCLLDAGVPPAAIGIVFGVPAEVSQHLVTSPVIRMVTFTGSVAVGKQLMALAAQGMKRTTMELGGHAPVIVCDDVDVDRVLDMAVASKYRNAGQVCVSPTRFLVHETLHERFAEGFAARAREWRVGDGQDESVQMGPLIHARRLAAIQGLVRDTVDAGADLLCGGERLDEAGYFHAPTAFANVPSESRLMNDEPFGPIAIINAWSDLDEVIAEANRLEYGLAAYAFTTSGQRGRLLSQRVETGMFGLNTFQIAWSDSPFGGVKASGHGSEEGIEGLESCLVTKFVSEA